MILNEKKDMIIDLRWVENENPKFVLIDDLYITNKAKRFLHELGLTTIEELSQLSLSDLKNKQVEHKAIGNHTFDQIVIALHGLGLKFKAVNSSK